MLDISAGTGTTIWAVQASTMRLFKKHGVNGKWHVVNEMVTNQKPLPGVVKCKQISATEDGTVCCVTPENSL